MHCAYKGAQVLVWVKRVKVLCCTITVSSIVAIAFVGLPRGAVGVTAPEALGAAQATQLEDVSREEGPFALKNQRFLVVLHEKHIPGLAAPDPEMQTTLAAIEIKDAAGTLHYQKTFPYEVSGNEFSESLSASVQVLEGKQAKGLLITYGAIPSTPLGGLSWQVFGLFDTKLVSFSKPIYLEGDLINQEQSEQTLKTSNEPGFRGEVLHFRVWTGNFFAIVPVRVDWLQAKLMPAWQCQKMTSQGWLPLCRFRVETDRVPQEDELTFVRLYPAPDEEMGTAEHVVIKRDSAVEFLETEGELQWEEDDAGIGLNVSGDLWLKVRIDGKEGWIHTQEDFDAIGLPQAG